MQLLRLYQQAIDDTGWGTPLTRDGDHIVRERCHGDDG